MRPITFHDYNTIRTHFLEGSFASVRWIFTEFGKNTRKCYWHTEFVVTDEILRNFYASYNCNFKVYMKDKSGNYVLLFRVLADAQDRYAFRVIPCVTPPDKKGNIHVLVMEISKNILNTRRNDTGDRLYSAIDTVKELRKKHRNNNSK